MGRTEEAANSIEEESCEITLFAYADALDFAANVDRLLHTGEEALIDKRDEVTNVIEAASTGKGFQADAILLGLRNVLITTLDEMPFECPDCAAKRQAAEQAAKQTPVLVN